MENRVRIRPASPLPAGRTGGMGMVLTAGGQSFPPVAATLSSHHNTQAGFQIMLWKLLKKLNSLRKSSRGTVAG